MLHLLPLFIATLTRLLTDIALATSCTLIGPREIHRKERKEHKKIRDRTTIDKNWDKELARIFPW